MSARESFVETTAGYEAWRSTRIPMVEADLLRKHEKMAQSPFVLLRGSYYRFLQQFGRVVPEVADAPKALVVGDLHIENFGTWRDGAGRLAWGINDFDEIDVLPYTVDLTRLATSAVLAIREGHVTLNGREACTSILDGWKERIEQGMPTTFVLGERHVHLFRLASEAFASPVRFASELQALPAYDGRLPKPAMKLLSEVVPWSGFDPTLRTRSAGVGSLGARRIVAFGELAGGLLVREAKQVPGPASGWLTPKRERHRGLPDLVAASRGAASDPWRRQTGKWVVRPLAADAARLELASLKRKHDEGAYLRDMGAEAANVHLVSHSEAASAKAMRKDAHRRMGDWLHVAATKMAALTDGDHAEWTAMQRKAAR
jgi:hypothetical protein